MPTLRWSRTRSSLPAAPPLFALALGAAALLGARQVVRARRRFALQGKSALVTGGSRGLGLVLARQLVARGARVTICARDAAELRAAERDLVARAGDGARVFAVACDVTQPGAAVHLVDAVTRRFGAVDVLINNAGTIVVGPQETMTRADYEDAMAVHFWAALDLVHAVLPQMKARGAGRIVNISSIGGKIAAPHLLPYSASKFALVGLSEGLRAELSPHGVYVTTVCPSLMRTGSPRHALFKGQHAKERAWFTIADATPGLSIGAERAARRILDALVHGSPEVVLSLPGRLAVALHGVFPGLTADVAALVNALLPAPGGVGEEARTGAESASPLAPSWLTTLDERAAARNNERHTPGEGAPRG